MIVCLNNLDATTFSYLLPKNTGLFDMMSYDFQHKLRRESETNFTTFFLVAVCAVSQLFNRNITKMGAWVYVWKHIFKTILWNQKQKKKQKQKQKNIICFLDNKLNY